MKRIGQLLWQTKKYLKRYSPTILSSMASVGVIASTIMAAKETPKFLDFLEETTNEKEEEISKTDVIRAMASAYMPTAIVCLSTVICIFGANALNKKQQALLTSAYIMLEDSFRKYRTAAINVYGEDADSKIKAETAEVTYVHHDGYSIYDPGMDIENEQLLFYDIYTKRYFNATLLSVINAQYHLNRNLTLRGYVTINEFYNFIGIAGIENGDDIGWNMDYLMTGGLMWLDFDNLYTKMEDGMECCIITPLVNPKPFSIIDEEMSG